MRFDSCIIAGWENRSQGLYGGQNQVAKQVTGQSIADSSIFTGLFVDSQSIHHQPPPKLEDFLGGDTSSFQTETQDSSSLTHIYDQSNSAYFNDHHDFKTVGFQAFSANSGSEVDDSASVARTQLGCVDFTGQYTESGHELALSQCPTGALSLGGNIQRSEKALVSVDSDNCKKITDTFGQRTSIYRGVTRYSIFLFLKLTGFFVLFWNFFMYVNCVWGWCRHRWTGRYEAHLWDNSCRREGQARKGRQGATPLSLYMMLLHIQMFI